LLNPVRREDPQWFLSVDSNILLHQDALLDMFHSSRCYDAVGSKVYLHTVATDVPNYGRGRAGGISRRDEVFRVEILMALKLLSRAAYHVDYAWNPLGEDIGWSRNARSAGLVLGWNGRHTCKHVMSKADHDRPDRRIGW
jgi:hypothetical protein